MKIKLLIDDTETYQWEFNIYDGFELTDGTFTEGLKTAKRYEIPDDMNGLKNIEVFDVTFEDVVIFMKKRLKDEVESQGLKSKNFCMVR